MGADRQVSFNLYGGSRYTSHASYVFDWEDYTGTGGSVSIDIERESESRSYYSRSGQLLFHQNQTDTLRTGGDWGRQVGAFEEYWYDALGRRVLKYSLQDTGICGDLTSKCFTSMTRFVWDGDQLLWELRSSSTDQQQPSGGSYDGQTGVIGYVHIGELDIPAMMVRNDVPIYPHTNWRGLFTTATNSAGDQLGCVPSDDPPCLNIRWPAQEASAWQKRLNSQAYGEWWGSLIANQRDASGLLYRRNRYYDPESGQFTQQDPIGIAGGLNLYGYANGDPINFSDPFGLCPEEDPGCEVRRSGIAALTATAGFVVGGGIGVGATILSGGVLASATVQSAAIGTTAGLAIGLGNLCTTQSEGAILSSCV
jgi:RHS repeat-associated protein